MNPFQRVSTSLALLLGATALRGAQPSDATVSSPNGEIALEFHTARNKQPAATGQLTYSVTFRGKSVITPSALGLELQGEKPRGANVQIATTTRGTLDEPYTLVAGKTSRARNQCNTLRLDLTNAGAGGTSLAIEARVFNDAVAFRYVLGERSPSSTTPASGDAATAKDFALAQEKTEFQLPNDATTWALVLGGYRSSYESEFVKLTTTALGNQGMKSKLLVGCPLLLELPGTAWLAIDEADLRGNAKMYLTNPSGGWNAHGLQAQLAPQIDHPEVSITGTLPHHSAWRVIFIADHPGRFIESSVLTNLNPPTTLTDTSWIHAGKASWDWWSGSLGPDGQPAFTTATMKYYVDFAARSGLEAMLIDAGWSARDNPMVSTGRVDVPEVVRYARGKNVRVWVWAKYDGLNQHLEEAFAQFEQWGVAGVKTDFIERDDQAGIEFYYRSAETAARHHIMMDYHGASAPWGIQRTWPNVMGYEGVLGMEQSRANARDNPEHRVTLPFTRMLGGLMDYTPGGFDNVTREQFVPRSPHAMVMGTRAQQLAMYVAYEVPSQMVSDWPGNYEGQPAFQFIKDVPATWDETRVLAGYPGEFVTIARRRGDAWFVGAMTNWSARTLQIPLDFLPAGNFTAEIYADAVDAAKEPKHVQIDKRAVTRTSTLTAELAPGGGYAVRIVATH